MADFHPKVTATALAGALTSMIVAEVQRRGISIDAAEASSITVILSVVAGYFVPGNGDSAPVADAAVAVPVVIPPPAPLPAANVNVPAPPPAVVIPAVPAMPAPAGANP